MIYNLDLRNNEVKWERIDRPYKKSELVEIINKNTYNTDESVYFLNSERDKSFRDTFKTATTPNKADKLVINLNSNKKSAYVTMCDDGWILSKEESMKLIKSSTYDTALRFKELLDNDPDIQFVILDKNINSKYYSPHKCFNNSLREMINGDENSLFMFKECIDINKMISEELFFKTNNISSTDFCDSIISMLASTDDSVRQAGKKIFGQMGIESLKEIIYILKNNYHSIYGEDNKALIPIRRLLHISETEFYHLNAGVALEIVKRLDPPNKQEIMALFDKELNDGWTLKYIYNEMDSRSN